MALDPGYSVPQSTDTDSGRWLRAIRRYLGQLEAWRVRAVAGWSSTQPGNDWVPNGADQWVGNADKMPEGVAIGQPTGDPDDKGVEGFLTHRADAADPGGLAVVGFRDQETSQPLDDPALLANAALDLAGAPLLLSGPSGTWVQTAAPIVGDDYYVLVGETITLADGRHFAPLQLGPRYVPGVEHLFTESLDYSLSLTPSVVLAGSTIPAGKSFAADDTVISVQLRIREESSNRTSTITVEVWVNNAALGGGWQEASSQEFPMSGNSFTDIQSQQVTTYAWAPGDQIELRVWAVEDHVQSDPWVRGTQLASQIEFRQG